MLVQLLKMIKKILMKRQSMVLKELMKKHLVKKTMMMD